MKRKSKRIDWHAHADLLAGFFVLSGLIIVSLIIVFLLQRSGFFNRGFIVHAIFDNGIGLRRGAEVQFNGVRIGHVEEVSLMDGSKKPSDAGKVSLGLRIMLRYSPLLTDSSVAYAVRDKNLVSDRVINIESFGKGQHRLRDGDTISVADSRDIESVLSSLSNLVIRIDTLIANVGEVVEMGRDPNSSVGAMLGSRELYDRLITSLDGMDGLVLQGSGMAESLAVVERKIAEALPNILNNSDSITTRLMRTSKDVESLGEKSLDLADNAESLLNQADILLREGNHKMSQASDLMSAISNLWFIRSKKHDPDEFPLWITGGNP